MRKSFEVKVKSVRSLVNVKFDLKRAIQARVCGSGWHSYHAMCMRVFGLAIRGYEAKVPRMSAQKNAPILRI